LISRFDSTVGATGAFYALRRNLFEPIPRDTILDDLLIPMRIARRGFRILYEPEARAHDRPPATIGSEMARKVRTIAGNFHLFAREPWLLNPFANRLYPESLDVLEHLAQWGPTVILSDGDVVFQPRKIECSGLFDAVERNVLIYIHKEKELEDVERRYPAEHYVLVDDKLRILTAVKRSWGERVRTVFVRQGHYARAPEVARCPPADVTIERIGNLLAYDIAALLHASQATEEP